MKGHMVRILVVVSVLLSIGVASGATLTVGSSQDAAIVGWVYANTNFGSRSFLMSDFVDATPSMGLIQFDLSSIPAQSRITSARMQLYQTRYVQDPWSVVGAYRVSSVWSEQTVNYSTRPTWDPSPVASLKFDSSVNVHRTWDVTSVVQDWVNGTYANEGLLLWKGLYGGYPQPDLASREFGNPDMEPQLIVEYEPASVPEPGSLLVLGSGIAGLLSLVGRRIR